MRTGLTLATLTLIISAGAMARPMPENESVRPLIIGAPVYNLDQLQEMGLNSGRTELELWSGSYWPLYQGGIAVRYRDRNFARLISAKEEFSKFQDLAKKFPMYVYSGKENILSPAEKYDLVVGDKSMGLTTYSWKNSEKESSALSGKVPEWRGICDGFASASQMMPRPTKSVVMNTPEGLPITFYPEDIKALGSLSYARSQENVIMIGKRCRNAVVGLFTGACDEINAGNLHLALTNRVGKNKKSFIADVSPGSEVWNYPVKSYEITYYNVFTEEESKNFRDVMEVFSRPGNFIKGGSRHKRTKYIVGVMARVSYADMRPANLLTTDSAASDKTLVKDYDYDLELDANFNILGGENFSTIESDPFPDFIWAPNDGMYPKSTPEMTRTPEGAGELASMAREASKTGEPLSVIVRHLFEQAK